MFAPSYVNKVSGAIKFLFCDGASIEVIRYIFRLGTVGTDDEIFNTLGYVVTSSVFTNRVIRLTGLSSILNTTRRWKSSDIRYHQQMLNGKPGHRGNKMQKSIAENVNRIITK